MQSEVNFQGCQWLTVFNALNTVISCAAICPLDHRVAVPAALYETINRKFRVLRGTYICVHVKYIKPCCVGDVRIFSHAQRHGRQVMLHNLAQVWAEQEDVSEQHC